MLKRLYKYFDSSINNDKDLKINVIESEEIVKILENSQEPEIKDDFDINLESHYKYYMLPISKLLKFEHIKIRRFNNLLLVKELLRTSKTQYLILQLQIVDGHKIWSFV